MKTTRSAARKRNAMLGLTAAGIVIGGLCGSSAIAATFPNHAFFWTQSVPARDALTPSESYSFCKNNSQTGCTLSIRQQQDGYLDDLYDIDIGDSNEADSKRFPPDSVLFATPYGLLSGNNSDHQPFCTVGSFVSHGDLADVNCSWGTRLSVRAVSNAIGDRNTPISLAWASGGSGYAAYGRYDAQPILSFNSSGTDNIVTRVARGAYKVTMPGMGTREAVADGIAHVQAVTVRGDIRKQKRLCAVEGVYLSPGTPGALDLDIRCWGHDAVGESNPGFSAKGPISRMDAPFNFIYEFPGGGLLASVVSDKADVGTARHFPEHSSNSNISVKRKSIGQVGRYIVNLPNADHRGTNVQLTARGTSPTYCNVVSWTSDGSGGTDVEVACFMATEAGAIATDTQFNLGYYRAR